MNVNYARFSFPGLKSQFVYSASGTGARRIDRVSNDHGIKGGVPHILLSLSHSTKRNTGARRGPVEVSARDQATFIWESDANVTRQHGKQAEPPVAQVKPARSRTYSQLISPGTRLEKIAKVRVSIPGPGKGKLVLHESQSVAHRAPQSWSCFVRNH